MNAAKLGLESRVQLASWVAGHGPAAPTQPLTDRYTGNVIVTGVRRSTPPAVIDGNVTIARNRVVSQFCLSAGRCHRRVNPSLLCLVTAEPSDGWPGR
jgi:hypothetical protein